MRTRSQPSQRQRRWLSILAASLVLQGGALAQASETFLVFTKNGTEVQVNLGDHDAFSTVTVAPASLPASFSGSLVGATVAVVGTFDENFQADTAFGPIPRANIMFSGGDDPNVLTDQNIEVAAAGFYGGSDGFIDLARSIPLLGTRTVAQTANNSLQLKVGPNAGGQFPFSIQIPIKRHGRVTPVPVFGAAQALFGGAPNGPDNEFNVAFPLKVTEDGKISKFTAADLPVKTQIFAIFQKGGNDLIINLGDHDKLATTPIDISSKVPGSFGGLSGASFAVVGFFDEDAAGRSNLIVTTPTPPAPPALSDAQIDQAFLSAKAFFLDQLPSIPFQGALTISSADPNSFQSKFGCTGGGAFPASICGTVGAGGISIAITGAATNPHEAAQIQQLTLSPAGVISTIPTL